MTTTALKAKLNSTVTCKKEEGVNASKSKGNQHTKIQVRSKAMALTNPQ